MIILACDGLGALNKVQHQHISLSSLHFDFVSSIKSLISELPINIGFHHVKGHADDNTPFHQLSTIEKMNVTADRLAKEYNEIMRNNCDLEHLALYTLLKYVQ